MREKPRETRHERGVSRSSAGIGRCSRSGCGHEKRSVATSGRRSDSGDTHQTSIVYFFRKLLVRMTPQHIVSHPEGLLHP